jgi:signal transduction histidine kinase
VVSNLLDNAIKYTPAHGTVIVSTHWSLEQLELTIRDNGPGVPAAELPRLFTKYQRGTDSTRVEGSGLGLFIVKGIVEAHGGTVQAESADGQGTTVTVRLPTGLRDSTLASLPSTLPSDGWRALLVARSTAQ